MELEALTGLVVFFVVGTLCIGARVRRVCLSAHTASLRDRDEHKYAQVRQHV